MADVVVGMLGAGFAARLHVEGWRRVVGVDVALHGVVAAHHERARQLADETDIARVYADPDELFGDPEVNVVDLCVPNHLHKPFAIAALESGKHVVIEKPLAGAFVEPASTSAAAMLTEALHAADELIETAHRADRLICYAENWVYAPGLERAGRLVDAAGGTILRITGEESHSGTHAEPNKRWITAGGGSLLGKGCHPLAAALHLKAAEGIRRSGVAIRPVAVTAETASLTKVEAFSQEEHPYIRSGYHDVEDWGAVLVRFDDGTVAEIVASDTVLGGIRNKLTVFGSRVVVEANLNPNTALRAFAPASEVLAGLELSEKLETNAGWSYPSPDESWMQGYPQEIQDFAEAIRDSRPPRSDAMLGRDVLAVIYGAYVSAAEGRRVVLS